MIRKIKCNVDTTNINYTDFEGVKHMVIPVIMAQEGVMNRLFYPCRAPAIVREEVKGSCGRRAHAGRTCRRNASREA